MTPTTVTVTIDWTLVIAVYAAVVATFTLMWDWWKWKNAGPKITITAKANMLAYNMPAFEGQDIMVLTATNRGDRPTTITHFNVHQYKDWWQDFRKRGDFNAMVNVAHDMRPPPFVLEPGGTVTWACLQNTQMIELAKTGRLYLSICHSHSKKILYTRVFPKID